MEPTFPTLTMMTRFRSLSLKFAAAIACSAPFQAFAQIGPPEDVGSGDLGGGDIKQAIIDIVQLILTFIGILALVMLIWAGIRFIISAGDEGEKDKAKKMIIYVIIGLLIILIAKALVTFVISDLGGM